MIELVVPLAITVLAVQNGQGFAVLHQQNGQAFGVQPIDDIEDVLDEQRRQAERRLVQHQSFSETRRGRLRGSLLLLIISVGSIGESPQISEGGMWELLIGL